jgi:putative endonuclease
MSKTDSGRNAESRVADYLKKQGWKILSQNWRNRWCEIDIVAKHDNCVYFVEVKYRAQNEWGDGFDAITPIKLNKMVRAAGAWVQANKWEGEYQLAVVKVTDNDIELRYID